MHFPFSAVEVVWTLTFAALLVLLVVLLGRDRVGRFPLFTAGMVILTLQMLARRLLADKLAPLTSTELSLVLADIGTVITLLVALELGRRAFAGASTRLWLAGALVVVAGAGAVLGWWGPWPARETLFAHSLLAHLRLMQLVAEKGDLFNNLVFIELTLLAILTGRRFHAGWRGHPRQLLLGYSVAGLAQIGLRIVWHKLSSAPPTSEADLSHRLTLETRLLDGYNILYLVVIVAWIVCLWFDDPGYARAAAPASKNGDGPSAEPEPAPAPTAGKTDAVAAALERAIGPNPGDPPRLP